MFVFTRHRDHRTTGLKPGHYAKSLDPRADRCGWAIVGCPECKRLLTIGRNHRVSADGAVSPSLVCPYKCSFHQFVRLDRYADATAGDAR